MAAIAHGWKPKSPGLRNIPASVAREFNKADVRSGKLNGSNEPKGK